MFWVMLTNVILRIAIFVLLGYGYFLDNEFLDIILELDFSNPIVVIVFIYIFAEFIFQFIPKLNRWVGCGKMYKINFKPTNNLNKKALKVYTEKSNKRARWIFVGWIAINSIFLVLFWAKIINKYELVMLAAFYYVCDLICVLFFCPFQYILKTRCCVTCRIYNWDRFMYCLPLMPILQPFAQILFFSSLILLFQWEYLHKKHPERFYEKSNQALQCRNCTVKMCRIRGILKNHLL